MIFEWDSDKDKKNRRDHNVSLAIAELMFDGPVIIDQDDRFEYGEERQVARGLIAGHVFVCVFTDRGEVRRIISLRRATKREADAYYQGV